MFKYLIIAIIVLYLFRNYFSINVNIGNGAKKQNPNKNSSGKDVPGYSDYEEIK
jgi:hypothetical protein